MRSTRIRSSIVLFCLGFTWGGVLYAETPDPEATEFPEKKILYEKPTVDLVDPSGRPLKGAWRKKLGFDPTTASDDSSAVIPYKKPGPFGGKVVSLDPATGFTSPVSEERPQKQLYSKPVMDALAQERVRDQAGDGFKPTPLKVPVDAPPGSQPLGGKVIPTGTTSPASADGSPTVPTRHNGGDLAQGGPNGQGQPGPIAPGAPAPNSKADSITYDPAERTITTVPGRAVVSLTPNGATPVASVDPGSSPVGSGVGGAVVAVGSGGSGAAGARIYQSIQSDLSREVSRGAISAGDAGVVLGRIVNVGTDKVDQAVLQPRGESEGAYAAAPGAQGAEVPFLSATGGVAAVAPAAGSSEAAVINAIIGEAGPALAAVPVSSNKGTEGVAYNATGIVSMGLTVPEPLRPAEPSGSLVVVGRPIPAEVPPAVAEMKAVVAPIAVQSLPAPAAVAPVLAVALPRMEGGAEPTLVVSETKTPNTNSSPPREARAMVQVPVGPAVVAAGSPPVTPSAAHGKAAVRGITARVPAAVHPSGPAPIVAPHAVAPKALAPLPSGPRPARLASHPALHRGVKGLPARFLHLLQRGPARRIPGGGGAAGWWLSLVILAMLAAHKLSPRKLRVGLPGLPPLAAGAGLIAGISLMAIASFLLRSGMGRGPSVGSGVSVANAAPRAPTIVIDLGKALEKKEAPVAATAAVSGDRPSIASRLLYAQTDGLRGAGEAPDKPLVSTFSVPDETVVVTAPAPSKDPRAKDRFQDFVHRLVGAWTARRLPLSTAPTPQIILARQPGRGQSVAALKPAQTAPAAEGVPTESEAGFSPPEEILHGMGWGMALFLLLITWRARKSARLRQ